MSGSEYMRWDVGNDWKVPDKHIDQESIDICIENIKELNKLAKKMTKEEVKEFMEFDYGHLLSDHMPFSW